MKKVFLLALFLSAASILNAVDKITETVTVSNSSQAAVEQTSLTIPSGYTYSGTNPSYTSFAINTNMGMLKDSIEVLVKDSKKNDTTIYVTRKRTYRTIYLFSLTSIKYTATNHANVTLVKVNYGTTGYNHTFKITNPNSYPGSDEAIWATVGNSTTTQTGVTYSGYIINPASGLNTPITANLSSINHEIYLGIASEADSTSGSTAQVSSFSLEITYERDNEARTVVAQNDMAGYIGGQIYWDGTLKTSPQSQTLHENETHSFGVYSPQTSSNYNYIWNTGGVNTSTWTKRVNSGTPVNLSSNTTVQYTTNWSEVGTITYSAKMKAVCNVTFTGGGGTVTIDGGAAQAFPQTRQVIEQNSITAVASNYTSGGTSYTFNNTWRTSGGQNVTTSITPSQHETYTANYSSSITSNTTLQSNMSVPTGYTLNIPSGITVNLNGYQIYSTGGTITNQGTITGLKAKLTYSNALKGLFSNIETAISYASSGYEVEIQPGTYSQSVTVNSKNNLTISSMGNVNLTGAFTFYGCDNLEIQYAVYNKIGLYYCDEPRLLCSIDGSSSDAGYNIYYCTDFYQVYDINNCSTGLNVGSSSGYSDGGYYYCTYCGISASGGSNIGAYGLHFCTAPTYDFMSNSSSVIESYNCYFASGHPVNYESGGGNVDVNNGTFCGYPKAAGNTGTPETQPTQVTSDDPVDAEFQTINASYFTLMNKNREDKGKGISDKSDFKSGLLDIIKDYKSFIKKYPQSSFSRAALTTAANSFRLLDDTENRKSFLNDIINDKELTSLKGAAEILMIDYYTAVKDLNGAISAADAFINNYKNDKELLGEGLLKKGIILLFEMNQPETAAEYFTEVINNYPGSPLAEFAKNGLELSGKEVKETPGENIAEENNEFSAEAYPNPFNPTTTISFNLPEAGRVAVKVYDIMGAEVITLLDEERANGRQSVVWNSQNKLGSSVASGIYIYSITYKGQSISKKILMMK